MGINAWPDRGYWHRKAVDSLAATRKELQRVRDDRDHWEAQSEGWRREFHDAHDREEHAEDRAGSWWEAAKHYCRLSQTWEENHQILAEHFNRYVDQAEAAIDRLRERAHDAEDLAEQWRDRFEGERRHRQAERRGDSEVTNVVIEVERETEHGVSYDRYPRTFGYGLLLGELVVYDHDGMNIANYPVGTYGCVSSWEQGVDDDV